MQSKTTTSIDCVPYLLVRFHRTCFSEQSRWVYICRLLSRASLAFRQCCQACMLLLLNLPHCVALFHCPCRSTPCSGLITNAGPGVRTALRHAPGKRRDGRAAHQSRGGCQPTRTERGAPESVSRSLPARQQRLQPRRGAAPLYFRLAPRLIRRAMLQSTPRRG